GIIIDEQDLQSGCSLRDGPLLLGWPLGAPFGRRKPQFGHEVVEANSGAQALELISGQHFDLVITDYSMPGMTGAKLAQATRD
ncbi:response regulator, partial [Rhizobium ruizarguesonis]